MQFLITDIILIYYHKITYRSFNKFYIYDQAKQNSMDQQNENNQHIKHEVSQLQDDALLNRQLFVHKFSFIAKKYNISEAYVELFLHSNLKRHKTDTSKTQKNQRIKRAVQQQIRAIQNNQSQAQIISNLVNIRTQIVKQLRDVMIKGRTKNSGVNLDYACQNISDIRSLSLSIIQNIAYMKYKFGQKGQDSYSSQILHNISVDIDFLRSSPLRKYIQFSNSNDPLFLNSLKKFWNLSLSSNYNSRPVIKLFQIDEQLKVRLQNAYHFSKYFNPMVVCSQQFEQQRQNFYATIIQQNFNQKYNSNNEQLPKLKKSQLNKNKNQQANRRLSTEIANSIKPILLQQKQLLKLKKKRQGISLKKQRNNRSNTIFIEDNKIGQLQRHKQKQKQSQKKKKHFENVYEYKNTPKNSIKPMDNSIFTDQQQNYEIKHNKLHNIRISSSKKRSVTQVIHSISSTKQPHNSNVSNVKRRLNNKYVNPIKPNEGSTYLKSEDEEGHEQNFNKNQVSPAQYKNAQQYKEGELMLQNNNSNKTIKIQSNSSQKFKSSSKNSNQPNNIQSDIKHQNSIVKSPIKWKKQGQNQSHVQLGGKFSSFKDHNKQQSKTIKGSTSRPKVTNFVDFSHQNQANNKQFDSDQSIQKIFKNRSTSKASKQNQSKTNKQKNNKTQDEYNQIKGKSKPLKRQQNSQRDTSKRHQYDEAESNRDQIKEEKQKSYEDLSKDKNNKDTYNKNQQNYGVAKNKEKDNRKVKDQNRGPQIKSSKQLDIESKNKQLSKSKSKPKYDEESSVHASQKVNKDNFKANYKKKTQKFQQIEQQKKQNISSNGNKNEQKQDKSINSDKKGGKQTKNKPVVKTSLDSVDKNMNEKQIMPQGKLQKNSTDYPKGINNILDKYHKANEVPQINQTINQNLNGNAVTNDLKDSNGNNGQNKNSNLKNQPNFIQIQQQKTQSQYFNQKSQNKKLQQKVGKKGQIKIEDKKQQYLKNDSAKIKNSEQLKLNTEKIKPTNNKQQLKKQKQETRKQKKPISKTNTNPNYKGEAIKKDQLKNKAKDQKIKNTQHSSSVIQRNLDKGQSKYNKKLEDQSIKSKISNDKRLINQEDSYKKQQSDIKIQQSDIKRQQSGINKQQSGIKKQQSGTSKSPSKTQNSKNNIKSIQANSKNVQNNSNKSQNYAINQSGNNDKILNSVQSSQMNGNKIQNTQGNSVQKIGNDSNNLKHPSIISQNPSPYKNQINNSSGNVITKINQDNYNKIENSSKTAQNNQIYNGNTQISENKNTSGANVKSNGQIQNNEQSIKIQKSNTGTDQINNPTNEKNMNNNSKQFSGNNQIIIEKKKGVTNNSNNNISQDYNNMGLGNKNMSQDSTNMRQDNASMSQNNTNMRQDNTNMGDDNNKNNKISLSNRNTDKNIQIAKIRSQNDVLNNNQIINMNNGSNSNKNGDGNKQQGVFVQKGKSDASNLNSAKGIIDPQAQHIVNVNANYNDGNDKQNNNYNEYEKQQSIIQKANNMNKVSPIDLGKNNNNQRSQDHANNNHNNSNNSNNNNGSNNNNSNNGSNNNNDNNNSSNYDQTYNNNNNQINVNHSNKLQFSHNPNNKQVNSNCKNIDGNNNGPRNSNSNNKNIDGTNNGPNKPPKNENFSNSKNKQVNADQAFGIKASQLNQFDSSNGQKAHLSNKQSQNDNIKQKDIQTGQSQAKSQKQKTNNLSKIDSESNSKKQTNNQGQNNLKQAQNIIKHQSVSNNKNIVSSKLQNQNNNSPSKVTSLQQNQQQRNVQQNQIRKNSFPKNTQINSQIASQNNQQICRQSSQYFKQQQKNKLAKQQKHVIQINKSGHKQGNKSTKSVHNQQEQQKYRPPSILKSQKDSSIKSNNKKSKKSKKSKNKSSQKSVSQKTIKPMVSLNKQIKDSTKMKSIDGQNLQIKKEQKIRASTSLANNNNRQRNDRQQNLSTRSRKNDKSQNMSTHSKKKQRKKNQQIKNDNIFQPNNKITDQQIQKSNIFENQINSLQQKQKKDALQKVQKPAEISQFLKSQNIFKKCIFQTRSLSNKQLQTFLAKIGVQNNIAVGLNEGFFKNRHICLTLCWLNNEIVSFCITHPILLKNVRYIVLVLFLTISKNMQQYNTKLFATTLKYIFFNDPCERIIYLPKRNLTENDQKIITFIKEMKNYHGVVKFGFLAKDKIQIFDQKVHLILRKDLPCKNDELFINLSATSVYIISDINTKIGQKIGKFQISENFKLQIDEAFNSQSHEHMSQSLKSFNNSQSLNQYLSSNQMVPFNLQAIPKLSPLYLFLKQNINLHSGLKFSVISNLFYFTIEDPFCYYIQIDEIGYTFLLAQDLKHYYLIIDWIFQNEAPIQGKALIQKNIQGRSKSQILLSKQQFKNKTITIPAFESKTQMKISTEGKMKEYKSGAKISIGLFWKDYIKGVRTMQEGDIVTEYIAPFYAALVTVDKDNRFQFQIGCEIESYEELVQDQSVLQSKK